MVLTATMASIKPHHNVGFFHDKGKSKGSTDLDVEEEFVTLPSGVEVPPAQHSSE